MQYQINIIGCGRLGSTIGFLLSRSGNVNIKGVCNSSLASAKKAVKFVGQGVAYAQLTELPSADIYFITTPDNLIETTCNKLFLTQKIKKTAIVIHCSGSLSSDILHAAKQHGCKTASIHPIKSFANPKQSIKSFFGTFCAYEGDPKAGKIISELFQKIGARVFKIDKTNKVIYHAASVFAVNYLMALYSIAENCYVEAEIPLDTAKAIILNLMTGALENLKKLSPLQALTGPLQRGDIEVIAKHIEALSHQPEYLEIYRILGKATLSLTSHDAAKRTALLNLLTKNK